MKTLDPHSPAPFYEQLKELLRSRIAKGEFKPETALPDERSLAAELGLSRMTVRRAFVELSREGLLKRVRGRGTFVRGSFAPRPRRRAREALGIVASFDRFALGNEMFYHRLISGIQQASEKAGLLLACRRIEEPHEALVSALRRDKALKGLLIVGVTDPVFLNLLAALPQPSVLVDSCPPPGDPVFNEVNHDGRPAVRAAVEELIRLGHTDIGILISTGTSCFTAQRLEAWEAAHRAHGLEPDPARVHRIIPCGSSAYATVRKLIQEGRAPTAFFCGAGDELALGAMAAAHDEGWRVPRDLSVVGMGDVVAFSSPWLSTVRMPIEQLGATGVQVLLDRFKAPTAPLTRIMLPCEWIARASCACPRASTPPSHA
ncbi:MAG: GntR family transcriptional regulator [Planctomycetota bacterium]|nr:GntR family transcriptional regulator [Planctomycetota bacterium]